MLPLPVVRGLVAEHGLVLQGSYSLFASGGTRPTLPEEPGDFEERLENAIREEMAHDLRNEFLDDTEKEWVMKNYKWEWLDTPDDNYSIPAGKIGKRYYVMYENAITGETETFSVNYHSIDHYFGQIHPSSGRK